MPWYTVASEDSSNSLLPLCSCPPCRSLSLGGHLTFWGAEEMT